MAIDTIASWALDGLAPDEQRLRYIREFVESDMTAEEAVERAKARAIRQAQESDETAANRMTSGEPGLFPEIVDDLRKSLGAKLVAYIAGLSETRTVREWVEGSRKPSPRRWNACG
ncbi:antitoxin VbhA family protein [Microbacterium horticulturae]|uniref:Antitoxin VbhA family protein n=1 Tax=Microbacterium horticulturae TaxID=3028316 RepID=A0ABY8BWQ9_9MICO|nr:antitoxin VbhA family protein [Microbacterium sp. KACC 23027]WEG08619.1 antitoxin VbhA family protein [Microbacterium sp. KACC 23027]